MHIPKSHALFLNVTQLLHTTISLFISQHKREVAQNMEKSFNEKNVNRQHKIHLVSLIMHLFCYLDEMGVNCMHVFLLLHGAHVHL